MTESYTYIYRTGGFLNAKWRQVMVFGNFDFIKSKAAETERMGYKTLIKRTSEVKSVGLPVGYCARCNSETGQCTGKGKECRDNEMVKAVVKSGTASEFARA